MAEIKKTVQWDEIKTLKDVPMIDLLQGGSPTCAGCGPEIAFKLCLKAIGPDVVVVNSAGCHTLLCNYPKTPLKVPWLFNAIENADATASGIAAALRKRNRKAKVVCWAGDGASYDIGLQSLSGMAERGDNVLHLCYNNQSYANTGDQWAASTPEYAITKTTPVGKKALGGNMTRNKNLSKIMGAHMIYSATACMGYPLDLMNKVRKAAAIQGPAFIDILATCIPDWYTDQKDSVGIAKAAVDTGFWPLYEIEHGRFNLTYQPERLKPLTEFTKSQGRFRHLSKEMLADFQTKANKRWDDYTNGRFWESEEI